MRTSAIAQSLLWIVGLTGLLAMLNGCDTSVEPLVERERYFTLYGNFDMRRDTQFVRVIPIQRLLTEELASPLDAEVASTDRETGQRVVWKDSLVTFDDGAVGHVFWAVLDVQADQTNRLDVRRSDGATTYVTVRIPPALGPPIIRDYMFEQDVLWVDLEKQPAEVEVIYHLVTQEGAPQELRRLYAPEEGEVNSVFLPPTLVTAWRVTVDLVDDSAYLSERLGGLAEWRVDHVEMRISVSNSSLSTPLDIFDPEELSNPGTYSNVIQGFGLVGGIAQYAATWALEPDVQDSLGFGVRPDPDDDEDPL